MSWSVRSRSSKTENINYGTGRNRLHIGGLHHLARFWNSASDRRLSSVGLVGARLSFRAFRQSNLRGFALGGSGKAVFAEPSRDSANHSGCCFNA